MCSVGGGHLTCKACMMHRRGDIYDCREHKRPLQDLSVFLRAMWQHSRITISASSLGGLYHPTMPYIKQRRIVMQQLRHGNHPIFRRCPFKCAEKGLVGRCAQQYMEHATTHKNINTTNTVFTVSTFDVHRHYIVQGSVSLIARITIDVPKRMIDLQLLLYAPETAQAGHLRIQLLAANECLLETSFRITIHTPLEASVPILQSRCAVIGPIPAVLLEAKAILQI